MEVEVTNPAKVALYGVSSTALVLARACALRDNPVVGVYDDDPSRALQAALFLGTSARAEFVTLLADGPQTVIFSEPASEEVPADTFQLHLYAPGADSDDRRICWAYSGPLSKAIPTEIASDMTPMEFHLSGSPQSIADGRKFLQALSDKIRIVERGA